VVAFAVDWWIWTALGLVLAGIELFTPGGFFVMFFGVGALAAGLVVAIVEIAPAWQWLLFTAVSVTSLLAFRRPLVDYMRAGAATRAPVDALTSEIALAAEDIAPQAVGQAELRGSAWSARNTGTVLIAKGQRCRIDRVDGLVLWIRAEGSEP
jgi:membrane protein implicated in regulation of membrane protease activity